MTKLRINLALQGSGAHGAFTWGVLDRLLQYENFEIAAISGTSAGALNAAALKSGMLAGGSEGARASLDALWTEVARSSSEGMGRARTVFTRDVEPCVGTLACLRFCGCV